MTKASMTLIWPAIVTNCNLPNKHYQENPIITVDGHSDVCIPTIMTNHSKYKHTLAEQEDIHLVVIYMDEFTPIHQIP